MFWRVFFYCDPTVAPDLGNALEPFVSAVAWFEVKDSPLWAVEGIAPTEPCPQELKTILSAACAKLRRTTPSLTIEKLPEKDWVEATWQNFPPRQIGRYYIYGSHRTPKPPEGSIPLEINAATAFGSGEHETTAACLLALDALAAQGEKFQKPIDMGCGSGILGVAIAKTWSIPAIGADNDPEAVRTAGNNAILNHCPSLFTALLSEGFDNPQVQSQGPYDLIVANILAMPLIDMAPSLSAALAPEGWAILSGLLSRHQESVVKAYEAVGLRLISHRTLNDWKALTLRKEL